MDTIQIKVRLFGAFRNLGDRSEIEFSVPRGASLGEIKPELARQLASGPGQTSKDDARVQALVGESAFADEARILLDAEVLGADTRLAILPPVCGG